MTDRRLGTVPAGAVPSVAVAPLIRGQLMPEENLGGFGGQSHPTCGQVRWPRPDPAYAPPPAALARSLGRHPPATSRQLLGLRPCIAGSGMPHRSFPKAEI